MRIIIHPNQNTESDLECVDEAGPVERVDHEAEECQGEYSTNDAGKVKMGRFVVEVEFPFFLVRVFLFDATADHN